MSTNVRRDMGNLKLVASSKQTLATATTTSFDFGTPDDINLASAASKAAGYDPGDKILVVLTASTGGTTNNLTWVLQDSADNGSGAIGTPATAIADVVSGALAATTGDDFSAFSINVQAGRPWLRIRATSDGATDTFVCHCTVWAVPSGL